MSHDAQFELACRGWHQLLAESALDPAKTFEMGYNLLHCAIGARSPSCVPVLIEKGVDVHARTECGTTPLMKAMEVGQNQTARLLKSHGADVDAQDCNGNTAMHRGILQGNYRSADVLLSLGADPELANCMGHRPVELALLHGNAQSAARLGGSAITVVPGFISPKVQNAKKSAAVMIAIVLWAADLLSDINVALVLGRNGDTVFATLSWIILLLPSIVMFFVPFQSWFERVITLFQLRLLYESLISLGNVRFTVRFGAYRMLTAALEDIPHLLLQSYIAVTKLRGDTAGQNSVGISLLVSLCVALLNTSETLRAMYLQQYFVQDKSDPGTERLQPLTFIYTATGCFLKASTFVSLAVMLDHVFVIIPLLVLLQRLHLVRVFNVEGLSPIDPLAAILFDGALANSMRAVSASFVFSTFELCVGLIGPMLLSWFSVPGVSSNKFLIGIGVVWAVHALCLLVIYRHDSVSKGAPAPAGQTFSHQLLRCLWVWQSFPTWALAVYTYTCRGRSRRKTPPAITQSLLQDQPDDDLEASAADSEDPPEPALEEKKVEVEEAAEDRSQSVVAMPPVLQKRKFAASELPPDVRVPVQGVGCWKGFKRSPQVWTLLLTIVIVIWAGWQTTCAGYGGFTKVPGPIGPYGNPTTVVTWRGPDGWLKDFCYSVGPYSSGNVGLWLLFAVYCIYVLHSLLCTTSQYLRGMLPSEIGLDEYLRSVGSTPSIYWWVTCYHYETRTRQVTDSNGNTRTESYQVKVVTHRASMYWSFDEWSDRSDYFPPVHSLLKLQFQHNYSFADDRTRQLYTNEKAHFRKVNDRDTYQDFGETYRVRRISPMLVYGVVHVPKLLRFTYYFYAVLAMAAYPFRLWLSSLSAKQVLQMTKRLKKS